MKLEGRISIFVDEDGARIEITDHSSMTRFVKATLTSGQFMACLGRQGHVNCDLSVVGLDKVGKTVENSKLEFKIPAELYEIRYKEPDYFTEVAQLVAQNQLTDGWIADSYFGSQGSFFQKDGEQWARVTIRRWV